MLDAGQERRTSASTSCRSTRRSPRTRRSTRSSIATDGTVTSTSDPDELEAALRGRGQRPGQAARRHVRPAGLRHRRGHAWRSPWTPTGRRTPTRRSSHCPTGRGRGRRRRRYAAPDDGVQPRSRPLAHRRSCLLFLGMAVLLAFGSTRSVAAQRSTPMQQQLSLYTVHGMTPLRAERRQQSEGVDLKQTPRSRIADQLVVQARLRGQARTASSTAPGSSSRRPSGCCCTPASRSARPWSASCSTRNRSSWR